VSVRHLFVTLADSSVPDRELLDRFRRTRDEDAFAALVRWHGPMVWGVCRRVVGDAHAAEDAFQAVFLVLVLRADDAGRAGALGGWLHGVAVRTALKARRNARRTAAREHTGHTPPEPAAKPEPATDWLPVLDEELAALAEKYRLPVLLCDVQGLTLRAAADRLGVPVGTLSERLAKARGSLAVRLAKRGVGPAVLVGLAIEPPARLAAATADRAGLVACGGATVLPAVQLSRGVVQAMWWT
jgi:RNA polymerase sigma factor (sigma-70 family)